MEYKLIALDIDGTLLDSKEKISLENKLSIKKCIDKDIKVCLCTGRNIKNTIKIANQILKDMPFICTDGAVFYNNKTKKIILEKKVSTTTFSKIIEEANKYEIFMEFSTNKNYFKYAKNNELNKYSYGGVAKNIIEKFDHYFIKNIRYIKNIHSFIEKQKSSINQIILAGDYENINKLKTFFEKIDFKDIDIRYDLWENYIFIVPKGITKASGLNIFSDYFNIPIENMIAIGDQMNDIDMIKKAGLGIAMGNADDKIKDVAKFVTKTNDESGVAYAINKYVLK